MGWLEESEWKGAEKNNEKKTVHNWGYKNYKYEKKKKRSVVERYERKREKKPSHTHTHKVDEKLNVPENMAKIQFHGSKII